MSVQAQRWRRLVEARLADPACPDPGTPEDADRLATYAEEVADTGEDDPFLQAVLARTGPGATVLDVGAGAGRFALPLARHGRQVIAVEPRRTMLCRLDRRAADEEVADQLTTIHARWQDLESEPRAEVVVCAYVLPRIPDVTGFLARLDAAARRHVLVYLDATVRSEEARPPLPSHRDLVAVLDEMGLGPVSVELVDRPRAPRARWRNVPGAIVGWRPRVADGKE